jgi:SAM-dependent methyltransferase
MGVDNLAPRFFTVNDPQKKRFTLELPQCWWSRPYEYAWASGFIGKNDTVLDAACGVEHPFKFYLSDHCKEVYACDYDPRILSREAILLGVKDVFGENAAKTLSERYLNDIHYSKAPLTALPYPDGMFDKIFCISVLEHLKDFFNKYSMLYGINFLRFFVSHDIYRSLQEFRRTLKDGGLIILTFDYPVININYLVKIVQMSGLSFAGPVSRDVPRDALYFQEMGLNCYRAVLKKI